MPIESLRLRTLLVPLVAALVLAGCKPAAPRLTVTDLRAVATGDMAAVYMTIGNSGGADRLMGADAGEAGMAGLHTTETVGDVVKMRPATGGLAIPAGEGLILAPQGAHIMIMGGKTKLVPGERFALRLTFERHRPLALSVPIETPTDAE